MAALASAAIVPVAVLNRPAVAPRCAGKRLAKPIGLGSSSSYGAALRARSRSQSARKYSPLAIRAADQVKETDEAVAEYTDKAEELLDDLKAKWDKVENKSGVAIYAAGALVALWFSSTIVGAVNAIPLLPRLLELVGLGYTGWFVYRYLLFKSSRQELASDIEELKGKITGSVDSAAKDFEGTDTFKAGKSAVKEAKPLADSLASDTKRAGNSVAQGVDDAADDVARAGRNVGDEAKSVADRWKSAAQDGDDSRASTFNQTPGTVGSSSLRKL